MRLIRSATRLQSGLRAGTAVSSSFSSSSASWSRPCSTLLSGSKSQVLGTSRVSLPTWTTRISPSSAQRTFASSSSDEPLGKTALYDLHVAHGGKMVPFGGFHMPVQYASLSVAASHAFTRTHASLFDVSHMVQRIFHGPDAAAFLQRVTPSDLAALPVYASTLSALLHPSTGGIVDDTIITKLAADRFYVVTNAACRAKDDAYFAREIAAFDGAVVHEKEDQKGLVALQGPLSLEILAPFIVKADVPMTQLYFGTCTPAMLRFPDGSGSSLPALFSRGGYTGEDGFEISLGNAADTVAFTEALLASAGPERLQLAGLGARDSLRLEAGMCLYGHDLDDTTTPVEAGLAWIVPKSRRTADAGFHGAEVVAGQLVPKSKGGQGVTRRRVGFIVEGAPAREGAEVVSKDGEAIGRITSGCPSPTLGKNVAMGYVKDGFHKAGTEVDVVVRGRNRKATVSKMPFVPTKYFKGN